MKRRNFVVGFHCPDGSIEVQNGGKSTTAQEAKEYYYFHAGFTGNGNIYRLVRVSLKDIKGGISK